MKITFCHHYSMSFWSGGEKQTVFLAKKLMEDGFDVEICSLPVGKRNLKDIKLDDILGDVKYSEKWLHNIDADVAYFLYSPYIEKFFKFNGNRRTAKIAAIRGFPLVPEIQHKSVIELSPYRRIKEIGWIRSFIWWHSKYMRNLNEFDALHVLSPATIDLFKDFDKKIYYIPNWVNTDFYCPKLKNKYDNFTVLFAGRNEWVKGIDIYNEISKRKDLGIIFLATGGNKKGDYINLGFVGDNTLSILYSRAHVTVVPTRIDTFGNTILESLACGTPVITTKIPAHLGMKLPLIYADNPEEFLEEILKIKKMWEEKRELYNQLSSGCRESVSKYGFQRIYSRFLDMFDEVSDNE